MDEPDVPEIEPRKKSWWPYVGWSVIGLMVVLTILNLLNWIPPEWNRITLPTLVVLYLVYVVFRRRSK